MRHAKHLSLQLPSTSILDLSLPVECWLHILNWSIEPDKCDIIAMEQRPRCAASLITPISSHWKAEKQRRDLRLVCRSWKTEMDRLAGRWGVVTNTSAPTLAKEGKLRMARFDQSRGWRGSEKELLRTILVITKTTVGLAVLEVVLCTSSAAQLFEAVASWDHAICLQSLSLTISDTTPQSLDPQSATPLRLLPTISTTFPSLIELVIKDEAPIREDTMRLASFSRLELSRLQSFALHLPQMAINWDQAWWDLPSLLHLSVHIGCYVTPEVSFASFAPRLLSLSLIRGFGEPIYLGRYFWETFKSLQQIEVRMPYVLGSMVYSVPSWHPVRTLIICNRLWPALSSRNVHKQATDIFSNIGLFVDRDSPIDTVICKVPEKVLDCGETARDYMRKLLKRTGWRLSNKKKMLETIVDEEGAVLRRRGLWGLISAL
jgi:hypothetical protein